MIVTMRWLEGYLGSIIEDEYGRWLEADNQISALAPRQRVRTRQIRALSFLHF